MMTCFVSAGHRGWLTRGSGVFRVDERRQDEGG